MTAPLAWAHRPDHHWVLVPDGDVHRRARKAATCDSIVVLGYPTVRRWTRVETGVQLPEAARHGCPTAATAPNLEILTQDARVALAGGGAQ